MTKVIKTIEELPEQCLFFGYGSLMFPKGINGRGLKYKYTEHNELRPYMLDGFKRTMSAEYKYRYYGLHKKEHHSTFGVLIPIYSLFDLKALLMNEAAEPMWVEKPLYQTFDITDHVSPEYRGNLRVFTLICDEVEDLPHRYAPGYIGYVYKHIPKRYRELFLSTGGQKPQTIV